MTQRSCMTNRRRFGLDGEAHHFWYKFWTYKLYAGMLQAFHHYLVHRKYFDLLKYYQSLKTTLIDGVENPQITTDFSQLLQIPSFTTLKTDGQYHSWKAKIDNPGNKVNPWPSIRIQPINQASYFFMSHNYWTKR